MVIIIQEETTARTIHTEETQMEGAEGIIRNKTEQQKETIIVAEILMIPEMEATGVPEKGKMSTREEEGEEITLFQE